MGFKAALIVGTLAVQQVGFDPASAPEIAIPKEFEQVRAARNLDDQEFRLARSIAATYTFAGFCSGKVDLLKYRAIEAVQSVSLADPNVAYQAATLEMIAIMTRAGFGRPNEPLCTAILSIANSPLQK